MNEVWGTLGKEAEHGVPRQKIQISAWLEIIMALNQLGSSVLLNLIREMGTVTSPL